MKSYLYFILFSLACSYSLAQQGEVKREQDQDPCKLIETKCAESGYVVGDCAAFVMIGQAPMGASVEEKTIEDCKRAKAQANADGKKKEEKSEKKKEDYCKKIRDACERAGYLEGNCFGPIMGGDECAWREYRCEDDR